MATSIESQSPASLHKESPTLMMRSVSPPMFSPSSDKRFWSTLRSHVDTLIENRKPLTVDDSLSVRMDGGAKKRLKEDSLLLLRGFDSVAQSLSQLSNDLENARQGARDLARPPTLIEIVQATIEEARIKENFISKGEQQKEDNDDEENSKCLKRKLDSQECSDDHCEKEKEKIPQEMCKMKKAKNLAISLMTKATTLARELKLVRSDLSFVQERCVMLEEENKKLRDGIAKGIMPEEDDLVRLQLEALLAEKSRLANENAGLKRENQCLNQLVEYHQLNSEDLSASYESLIRGMELDFSSPTEETTHGCHDVILKTPREDEVLGFCKSLDECYDEEQV